MSGHSHWATIKRKKEAEDKKRGKLFSKLSRAIAVAARQGGEDPDKNPTLRTAIDKARSHNMPKENIERAVVRGAGGEEGGGLSSATYEGYGPQGTAFMVTVLTDNKNRSLAEIRKIFESHGGRIGEAGSAAYIFKDPEKPIFLVTVGDKGEAERVLALASALDEHDDVQDVYSNFDIPESLVEGLQIQ